MGAALALAAVASACAGAAAGWAARGYYAARGCAARDRPRGGGVGDSEMIGATLLSDEPRG